MKKILLFIITSIIFPLNIFAYSNYVYPGGENIGIEIEAEKVLVIGTYLNTGNNIKIGDYITKVNNISINNINDLVTLIDKYQKDNKINLTIERNLKEYNIVFKLKKEKNKYKTGLYVKDSISGIGTLTYIDPNSNIYGALGHEVLEANSHKRIEVKTGNILESTVTNIDRSSNGNPGSKNANISNKEIGSIKKNTTYGIYGNYKGTYSNDYIEVANPNEIKKGNAIIRTVLDDNKIKEYNINITKIDKSHKTKNLYFEIIDNELLNKTGGIVQGMSGSPIIQNNKIIGAVTHVVVDNVEKGYGIFITTMLNEGDKLAQ